MKLQLGNLISTARCSLGKNRPDREKGAITIAETLIALGVGSTIIAVVFAGIPALVNARNASAGVSGLTQIAVSVRSTFGARNNYTGLTTEMAQNLSGFPPNFVVGGTPQHPWGGGIDVLPDSSNASNFSITYKAMPKEGCTSIATTTIDLVESIKIGGTEVNLSATDDASTPNTDESEPADIAGLCNANAPADVIWTFQG